MSSALSALMEAAEKGDHSAKESLFTTLYSELHSMAKRELARRGAHLSLKASTLMPGTG